MLFVCCTPGIELEKALYLATEGTKSGDDGELYCVVFNADGIVIYADVRRDIASSRGVVKGRVTLAATLGARPLS